MSSTQKKTWLTNPGELKFSIILATIASIAVISAVVWSMLSSQSKPAATVPSINPNVTTTEKPKKSQQTTKYAQHLTHTPTKKTSIHKVIIGKGKLYVQVGAFKEVIRARKTYEKMRKTYKRAQIMPKSGYYAIWVGPVRSKAEAEILKKQILKHYKIKGFITSEK
ncbi:MAG: SPOR domain-containing protein [Ghiorsea sp.]|nr:SPOR domain-containing protein [Ghiorsea sp.]